VKVVGERLNDIEEIIYAECGEATQLEGDLLAKFKQRTFMDWEPDPIFYTKTKMILLQQMDYDRVKQIWGSKITDVCKLEMPDYNHYLYVVDIVDAEDLNYILGIPDEQL